MALSSGGDYNRFVVQEAGSIIRAMSSPVFEFRVCQNPACGLRYPLMQGSALGERCPLCLGVTAVVARSVVEGEQARPARLPQYPAAPAVLLDNIRSAWNAGSIFRSADGFGFRHVYLCGISPTPENPRLGKTALGAQQSVPWSSHRNAVVLLEQLKAGGHVIWALEQGSDSQPLEDASGVGPALEKLVLVVGNERAGVDPGILERADRVVHIDMRGSKRSLNVAVAFAVAAYALMRGVRAASR